MCFCFCFSLFPRFLTPCFSTNCCRSTVPPSFLQYTKGTITCCHCLPLTTCKEQAAMVSLFVFVFLLFSPFPRFLTPHFFNSIDVCPQQHPPSSCPQRKELPATTVCHFPLPTHKEKATTMSLIVFLCFIFHYSQDFSPPVFSIQLLSIHSEALTPSVHKGDIVRHHCSPLDTH